MSECNYGEAILYGVVTFVLVLLSGVCVELLGHFGRELRK